MNNDKFFKYSQTKHLKQKRRSQKARSDKTDIPRTPRLLPYKGYKPDQGKSE